jgi:hypothetical protein
MFSSINNNLKSKQEEVPPPEQVPQSGGGSAATTTIKMDYEKIMKKKMYSNLGTIFTIVVRTFPYG